MIGSAERQDGLYYLVLTNKETLKPTSQESSNVNAVTLPASALWHFRLGHISHTRINTLHSQFPFIVADSKAVCDVCHLARHKKLPFVNSSSRALAPYDLIHFDIWGPISTHSVYNHSYFLTAIDDHSRYTWITLMKHKSETRDHIQKFIKCIENQYNKTVKVISSNNGPEFLMHDFYASKGILHQTSCVESPNKMVGWNVNTNTF
jgi:hypothetical protein